MSKMPCRFALCRLHWLRHRPPNTASHSSPFHPPTFVEAVVTHGSRTKVALALTAPTQIFTFAEAGIHLMTVAVFIRCDATNLSYLTACICLAQWMSHNPLQEDPAATPIAPETGFSSAGPVPVSAPPAPSINRLAPWGGIPPAHLSASIGSASRSSQPSRRGPRNSFPVSSMAGSGASVSASSARSGSGVFSGNIQLLVAMYPLVEPGQYEIPGHPTHPLAV
ncbi:hypothetical protein B0H13DRAFT_2306050 [Mycena leptocephala]|nr:hypothetical protein B0H13DRAFT_2306050 [Mycena leptocephala]